MAKEIKFNMEARAQMQQGYMQKMRGVMQVLKDNVKIKDLRHRFF